MMQILSTFLPSFYADNVQKGLSALNKSALGTDIASPKVTITDDPFLPGNNLQTAFDGEGVPTYTKNIIENGQLKLFLHNLTTALKDGVESTGNGQRSGAKITTGVFNLLIQPGTVSKDELLAMADGGIYAGYFSSGTAESLSAPHSLRSIFTSCVFPALLFSARTKRRSSCVIVFSSFFVAGVLSVFSVKTGSTGISVPASAICLNPAATIS